MVPAVRQMRLVSYTSCRAEVHAYGWVSAGRNKMCVCVWGGDMYVYIYIYIYRASLKHSNKNVLYSRKTLRNDVTAQCGGWGKRKREASWERVFDGVQVHVYWGKRKGNCDGSRMRYQQLRPLYIIIIIIIIIIITTISESERFAFIKLSQPSFEPTTIRMQVVWSLEPNGWWWWWWWWWWHKHSNYNSTHLQLQAMDIPTQPALFLRVQAAELSTLYTELPWVLFGDSLFLWFVPRTFHVIYCRCQCTNIYMASDSSFHKLHTNSVIHWQLNSWTVTFECLLQIGNSWGDGVGALGYELDNRGTVVRLPAEARRPKPAVWRTHSQRLTVQMPFIQLTSIHSQWTQHHLDYFHQALLTAVDIYIPIAERIRC